MIGKESFFRRDRAIITGLGRTICLFEVIHDLAHQLIIKLKVRAGIRGVCFAFHLNVPGHFLLSGLVVYITAFNYLDCRQLFPDSFTDKIGGIEVETCLDELIDLGNIILGKLGSDYLAYAANNAHICAHIHFIS